MEQMAAAQAAGEQTEARTFTQEELEEILQKRLARDRKNRLGNDETRERELESRERLLAAKERLMEEGLPTALAETLRYEDGEALERAIEIIRNLEPAQAASWGQRPSAGRASASEDPIRKAMGLDQ